MLHKQNRTVHISVTTNHSLGFPKLTSPASCLDQQSHAGVFPHSGISSDFCTMGHYKDKRSVLRLCSVTSSR